jgi:BCD family chlorophyll transporter-like MFS transporter
VIAAPATTPATVGLRARDVVRLGLAQVAIGAVAALMTSTLNRVMVVELAMPASVPSALVALHFAVQLARARMGFASDQAGGAGVRRAPWAVGGAALLAAGAGLAAGGTALAATHPAFGIALCAVAYAAIGLGLSAAGTAVLAAAAERAAPAQLGRVAAGLWVMMILGIVLSAGITGALLDPFSFGRLVAVGGGVGAVALALTLVAASGRALRAQPVAPDSARPVPSARPAPPRFADAWRAAAAEPATRRFVGFVFLAMLAFSAQDLILEPFAGLVFGMTPGETTRLGGMQHGGVLVGMLVAAVLSARVGTLRGWAAGGCLASAAAFVALAQTPASGSVDALRVTVFALGAANGVFTVGGVGAMMALTAPPAGPTPHGAGDGRAGTGLRLGIFGAAQAVAYGTGGFAGGAASDLARAALGTPAAGYAAVFLAEAVLFAGAAWLALRSAPSERLGEARLTDRGADLVSVLN